MLRRDTVCTVFAALLVCQALVLCESAAAGDAEIAQALRAAGLRPVEPPTSAADQTLRSLDGVSRRVSDSSGRWLLLTFVASWCGPCVQEMPTLDAVANSELSASVDVVGVSIDRDGEALEAFLDQVAVSFPVFWDPSGSMAQIYRARSIPLTYVIDPRGQIRGVARGARDWSALGPLYQILIDEIPPFDASVANFASGYRDDVERVELPIRLTPPDARVRPLAERVAVGKPFDVEIDITWAGNFDEYLLHPPRIVLPEEVEQLEVAAETSGEGGDSVVTYRMSLEAASSGRFALDPIELRYTPRGDEEPLVRQIDGVEIEAVGSRRGRVVLVAVPAALLALALLGFLRRSRVEEGETPQADPWLLARELLEESSVHATKGDSVGTLAGLLKVTSTVVERVPDARDEAKQLSTDLEDLYQRCQFAGETLSAQELSRIHRRVERWFTDYAPDAAAAERERLEID